MSTTTAIYGLASSVLSNLFITLPIPKATPGITQQTFIVTGANQGLGYESTKHLLRIGANKVIIGVRNLEKGEKARSELLAATKREPESVEVWNIDMESYDSVKAFAKRASELPRLDGVLANAGIMTETFSTAEDNEKTITVNVVASFLLFLLVLPKLREAPVGGHFAIPNSALHYAASTKEIVPDRTGKSIFSRLNDPSTADMKDRYNLSKLLVIFVVRELDARMKASGKKPVTIASPNPNYCKSELIRDVKQSAPPDFIARTTEEGSRTLVHGLLAGPEASGQFLTNCHVHSPASFVSNKSGARIQVAFFEELIKKLDTISPGVSQNI